MVASQRIVLDSTFGEQTAASFAVRNEAPDILLFGNIGLSQWSTSAVRDIAKALDWVGLDDLAVHTNPLQEADQQTWWQSPGHCSRGDGIRCRCARLVALLYRRAAHLPARPRRSRLASLRRIGVTSIP
jgi:isopentenyl diphosphate isomerase/L-lactate dehydrogenase-like FMN-dependent dehydrogenase